MKYTEKNNTLTITDYPLGLLIFGVACGCLAFYVLYKGDVANFIMALLLSLVFSLYGKRRMLIMDKIKNIFHFKEKNIFGQTIITGSLSDIVNVGIHYGRGRTLTPSGFIVINLHDGNKMILNEYGRLIFGKNTNQEIVNKINEYIH